MCKYWKTQVRKWEVINSAIPEGGNESTADKYEFARVENVSMEKRNLDTT